MFFQNISTVLFKTKQPLNPIYSFIGIHSLLTGLFTFFIPVFLYKNGFSLSEISLFISIGGGAFIFSLYVLDRIRYNKGLKPLICISFLLEIVLVFTGMFEKTLLFLVFFAIIYGLYNCFFWITQRLLFLTHIGEKDIGNKFGNIQIIAFIIVKIGILIGAFILENSSYYFIILFASLLSSYGIYRFCHKMKLDKYFKEFSLDKPISIKQVLFYKDKLRSKSIFILDGVFLFLESFFWLITLFLIGNENYTHLGILVVLLALSFSIVFMGIKSKIDSVNTKHLFYIAVVLYTISWFLRGEIGDIENKTFMYSIILTIAFFTSFFRLVFNKQFFCVAKSKQTHSYILIKSYYSQLGIFVVFGLLSIFLNYNPFISGIEIYDLLKYIYYFFIPFAILYIFYKIPLSAR